ncbi:subclass B3 metallo-beta-lactamase [Sphingomonas crusticola]|uniref:subclass B3 metallo-beta-lactamase n=1 Tax=Sphingomonas crusticola TaxID=1697973 RepID=UPI001F079A0B|nr:subclass B3 metallo-beta-lactamase [Sphingomonas crusticola]
MRGIGVAIAIGGMLTVAGAAQADWPSAWHEPTEPFHVVGNVYYVGSKGLAAYLLVSPHGNILIDGTMAQNVPAIERNIAKLGFRVRDVKLLLNTHAHFDHAAGLAALKRDSGAKLLASAADRPILESGHIRVENSNDLPDFPPVKVDGLVSNGQVVRLGPIALKATLTPGHTPGCTSWSTIVQDKGRRLAVVFPCSITTAGNKLIGNKGYPGIVADYRLTFARLGAMKADVVLTAHPELSDVLGRAARRRDESPEAFIDRNLLPKLVGDARAQFEADLRQEQGASAR